MDTGAFYPSYLPFNPVLQGNVIVINSRNKLAFGERYSGIGRGGVASMRSKQRTDADVLPLVRSDDITGRIGRSVVNND